MTSPQARLAFFASRIALMSTMMGAFGAGSATLRMGVWAAYVSSRPMGVRLFNVTPGGGNGSNVEIPEYAIGWIRPAGRILRGDA